MNLKQTVREILDAFKKVADKATEEIKSSSRGMYEDDLMVLAARQRISSTFLEAYLRLQRKPFIARVTALKNEREKKVFYICKASSGGLSVEGITLASYLSPVGRLASYPVGDEILLDIPAGRADYYIEEKFEFEPVLRRGEWDSCPTQIEFDSGYSGFLPSLREVIKDEETKPAPKVEIEEVKPEPKLEIQEAKPAPKVEIQETKPAPKVEIQETKPAPKVEIQETKSAPKIEIEEVQPEPKVEIEEVQPEPKVEIEEVTLESKVEIEEVRSESKVEIEDVKPAPKAEIQEPKSEPKLEIQKVKPAPKIEIEEVKPESKVENKEVKLVQEIERDALEEADTLRDQAILDRYQDEIFRLPLNRRLVLLGSAGTGKTTTLIKRLAQKSQEEFLTDEEKGRLKNLFPIPKQEHNKNWLVFTPNELLKLYVKETFAENGVPASDKETKTWEEYRFYLARNVFDLIFSPNKNKKENKQNKFIIDESKIPFSLNQSKALIRFFDDFDQWQKQVFVRKLQEIFLLLKEEKNLSYFKFTANFMRSLETFVDSNFYSKAYSLDYILKVVANEANLNRVAIEKFFEYKRQKAIVLLLIQTVQYHTQKNIVLQFLQGSQMKKFIPLSDSLKKIVDNDVGNFLESVKFYGQKIKEFFIFLNENKKLRVKPKEKNISKDYLLNPIDRYIKEVPKRYKEFRLQKKYKGDKNKIHPLELDFVLLAILRAGGLLENPRRIWEIINKNNRNADASSFGALSNIVSCFKNQIIVDEIADFSPIQIACMFSLTHPQIKSFFACGDFNQRLTLHGIRSLEELKWAAPDIEEKIIKIPYRQSKELNDFANAIIQKTKGKIISDKTASRGESGIKPILLEKVSNFDVVADWLTKQIGIIQTQLKILPSIAVLVPSDNESDILACKLKNNLSPYGIDVLSCRGGQMLGRGNQVRVFDIQYIKGMEFEVVFFISIDKLEKIQTDLFDQYLYLGASRPATYLGMTCEKTLPAQMETLRPYFVKEWVVEDD